MLAAGSTIGRRYRLTSLIGEGGMASVWCADDGTLRRSVAIKLLYLHAQRDPQASVEQFLREARIAAAVQHRNVIQTVDFGTTDDGIPYMVMELLHGESLAARMDREPPLRIDEVVRLAELTLRGLSAVHEAGIVHRDLKPQNIFLQQDADSVYPKILDFGISRSVGGSGELASPVMTQLGVVVGTPHYMAPEQARGETQIDKRADIYSMGAILYEGLTGRVPFDAPTSGELLVKILTSEPRPLRELRPEVPAVVAECVAQAMASAREQRFVDAKAFRSALQSAADSAFADQRTERSSELPATAQHVPRALQIALPKLPPLAAAPPQAWGDFEGLEARAAPQPSRPLQVSQPITASAGPRALDAAVGARVSQPRAAVSVASQAAQSAPRARSSEARARAVSGELQGLNEEGAQQDGYLLGDNPLDAFAGSSAVALDLAVDLPRASSPRNSPLPAAGAAKRKPAIAHAGLADRTVGRALGRPSAWWLMPGLLLLAWLLFLIAPGLVSNAPPDDAAMQAREAQNPATRGSSRTLQKPRPRAPNQVSPALRELLD